MQTLWTITETAQQLAVSVRTVQRLLDNGDLPTVRVRSRRLVPVEQVQAWIERQVQVHNDRARARMTAEKPTIRKKC